MGIKSRNLGLTLVDLLIHHLGRAAGRIDLFGHSWVTFWLELRRSTERPRSSIAAYPFSPIGCKLEICTVATNDLYRANYRFEGEGSGFTVGIGFRQVSGTNDENTLQDLCDVLFIMSTDEFLAILSDGINQTGIEVFQVTGSNETPGRLALPQPNSGTVVSDALPMGGALVLSLLTNAPNSRFNGRIYIAGIPESGQDEGQLESAYITDAIALAAVLDDQTIPLGPGSAVFKPVVISRWDEGIKRVPPVGFDVLSISVNSFVKNQRRRNTKFIGAGAST